MATSPDIATAERLKLTEIFLSVQGEARQIGWPTVFVRLTGCPLRCGYCDTAYAFHGGEWWAIDDILAAAGPDSAGVLPLVQLRQMGGALSRQEPGAGARATLPGEYCLFALGVPMDEEIERAVNSTLAEVEEAVADLRVGEYPNFVEENAEARGFWDEETWARLREVKSDYDPEDLFLGNHRIPPAA